MGAVEQGGAGRDFVERLDEHRAAVPKSLDDELVVDDLVIDVKGRPEEIECALEAFDRHVDAGAKASGIGQDDLHREGGSCFVELRRPYPMRLACRREGETGRACHAGHSSLSGFAAGAGVRTAQPAVRHA